jgi:Holliday junction DNA helicase RuvB
MRERSYLMSDVLRIVRDEVSPVRPAVSDAALRPTSFDEYVGQTEVIASLRNSVRAARRGGWQLDHYLFAGPAGLGKTSLAAVVASELRTRLHATSAPAIEHKGALATLLTSLANGDVLFVDEIHALDRSVAECLYSAMEDRVIDLSAGKRVVRVSLPSFTFLGATTHPGRLPKPLLDRFGFVWQLRAYTLPETQTIVTRAAGKLGVAIDDAGALVIARASRGTPRIANRLLRRVRDTAVNAMAGDACVHGGFSATIDGPVATLALDQLGIDSLGLGQLDRRYLAFVSDRPIGLEAICAALGEDRSMLEAIIEPYLVQLGFLVRTARGRVVTAAGHLHFLRSRLLRAP